MEIGRFLSPHSNLSLLVAPGWLHHPFVPPPQTSLLFAYLLSPLCLRNLCTGSPTLGAFDLPHRALQCLETQEEPRRAWNNQQAEAMDSHKSFRVLPTGALDKDTLCLEKDAEVDSYPRAL